MRAASGGVRRACPSDAALFVLQEGVTPPHGGQNGIHLFWKRPSAHRARVDSSHDGARKPDAEGVAKPARRNCSAL